MGVFTKEVNRELDEMRVSWEYTREGRSCNWSVV